MLKVGSDHFEATHHEPKVDVCDKQYVFDAQQLPSGSKPLSFESNAKCPAFVVNAHIARAALDKQRADDAQYDQLVKANTPVEPIHSSVDGGMNRVFLAQVGGRLPPARFTSAQGATQAEGSGSFTSKLLGFFGWKSPSQVEVASANAAIERASPQVTGTTPKTKPTPLVTGSSDLASAALGKDVSGKSEEMQSQPPVVGRDAWSQETVLTFSQAKDDSDALLPSKQIDSFVSRWGGLPTTAPADVSFRTRWALESQ